MPNHLDMVLHFKIDLKKTLSIKSTFICMRHSDHKADF